jgi:hypothetical protein
MTFAVGLRGQSAPATDTDVASLMARTHAYLVHFVRVFANVVAEEVYTQRLSNNARTREIRSDFYLVSPSGAPGWLQLRDVYAVDGRPVRDREERLARLVAEPRDVDWTSRAAEIGRESARYNLAQIGTFNVPLNALGFLQAQLADRFTFAAGPPDPKVALAARVVQFRETGAPLFSGVPLRGRAWIDEPTGAVLRTELLIGKALFPGRVVTTFRFDPAMGVHVPASMDEWYPLGSKDLSGAATYGGFRRFAVTSEERFVTPIAPRIGP